MTEEKALSLPNMGQPLTFNSELEMVSWGDIQEQIAPQGVNLETNELIDQDFTILRMKPYPSKYQGQTHVYYVVGATLPDGELFNTTLGGMHCVEVLDALMEAKPDQPIKFTLRWNEGGAHDGYYTLE